jgi:hypothetical protein
MSRGVFKEYPTLKSNIGISEREILALVAYIIVLKALCTEASRHLQIVRISASGFTPPSPQPCKAWHGYRFTIAHREGVGVSADGPASAPPFGVMMENTFKHGMKAHKTTVGKKYTLAKSKHNAQ